MSSHTPTRDATWSGADWLRQFERGERLSFEEAELDARGSFSISQTGAAPRCIST